MATSETLRAAKRRLETDGWCQGKYFDESAGSCCMVGAIILASVARPIDRGAAMMAISEALLNEDTVMFNDAPGRTIGQVLAVFDVAIGLAEQRELHPS